MEEDLAIGQRWISETEPELGLGTLIAFDNRILDIKFTSSGNIRKYSIKNAPLKRVIFKIGDRISDLNNNSIIVEEIKEENNLLTYISKDLKIKETEVSDNIGFTGAEDRLLIGQTDENATFDLRYKTLLLQSEFKKSDVRGFTGPRVELLPHQLYIAHEATQRFYPRIMLADEVGLGKTIEAGLIIHNLLSNERVSRILVITPEPLVNQWFVEMLRKFNISFNILDEEHCNELETKEVDEDFNPFQEYQLVITSIDFLSKSEWYAEQAIESDWDLLVVDEAHHLTWTPQKVSREYKIVEELSMISKGVLLLTATPEQMGIQSHFARLRILDPDRFYDLRSFIRESEDYKEVAYIANKIINNQELDGDDLDLVYEFVEDEEISKLVEELDIEENRKKLIQSMVDQHGTGRVLFRNTRAAMHNFPKRILEEYPLEKSNEKKDKWWKTDSRIDKISEIIKSLEGEKILLICQNKQIALDLEEALKEKVATKTTVFHEGLSLIARDRNAAYFREPDGANVLISSEIGSEGRNFQFSSNLILFDLPSNPDLLEQRIGRLDRIGQKKDIVIHVPYIKGTSQNILFDIYDKGLNTFREHIKGANLVFAKFNNEITNLLENSANYNSEDKNNLELIKKVQDYKLEVDKYLEEGKDKLLEINSFNPEIGNKIIEKIKLKDNSRVLEEYMNELFDHFGVDYEEIDEKLYTVVPADNMFVETFPQLNSDGATITYDRKTALEREDYRFLTFEHPMVNGAIDLFLSSEKGNSAVGVIESDKNDLLIETIFVLETVALGELQADRFLPPTPIRVLINKELKEEIIPYSEISKNIKEERPEKVFEAYALTQDKMTKIIQKSKEIAILKTKEIIKLSQEHMIESLAYETKRLISLQKNNPNVSEEEIEFAKENIAKLNKYISEAMLRLDSIRLIELKKSNK